ncbi:MAG TPA: hypothetical protein VF669_23035 [Tepidisphaeraceae bacterium]
MRRILWLCLSWTLVGVTSAQSTVPATQEGLRKPPDLESAYSVRVAMRILNLVKPISNRFQIARVLRQTDQWTEIEFTLFPLEPVDPVVGNPKWKEETWGKRYGLGSMMR